MTYGLTSQVVLAHMGLVFGIVSIVKQLLSYRKETPVRKVVVSEFVSLDNVMEAPGPDGSGYLYAGWTMPYGNEQFMKFKSDELMSGDVMLLGRITYEGFAQAWPERHGDAFSDKMNSMPKYVVTKTLQTTEWNNAHIISSDLQTEVTKLKEAGDGDILVAGSAQLVRGLMASGLVDELRLLIYPVVLGTGNRLFEDNKKMSLKLVRSEAFDSGIIAATYEPAP